MVPENNDSLQTETGPVQIVSPPQPVENTVPVVPASPPPPPPPPAPAPRRNKKLLLAIGAAVLLVLFGGTTYYLGTKGIKLSPFANRQQLQDQSTGITEVLQTPLFSGQLKRLDQDLGIFKYTEEDELNRIGGNSVYYEAGQFSQGELEGYSRVIAIGPSGGPGQPPVFVLATKDYQSYILDDPDNKTTKYPESDWQNPYNVLDKNKIASTQTLDTEQPKEIALSQKHYLYLEEFPTVSVPTSKTDKYGNSVYDTLLVTDLSAYQELSSPFSNLTVYFKPYETDTTGLSQMSQEEKEKAQLRQQYLLGETEVIVVDTAGLPIAYSLTTPGNIKVYNDKLVQYEIAQKEYLDQLEKFGNKQITQYPVSPDWVYLPNMGFAGSMVKNLNNLQVYKSYETAVPTACTSILNSHVAAVIDNDLEQIGSVFDLPLYRLKDTKHPLYTLAFKNKMDYYDQDPATWDLVNKDTKKPTLEEYVSINPLLFVKDYWQRWVVLGEFDIKLPSECGKPVVYLYPEKPTSVSVKFQAPVRFTADIPKYTDFWQVLAYPNGSLVDLRPELTDCSQIDFRKAGSEYAREACQRSTYPYLYWAGSIYSKDYPVVDGGWVVDRNDLGVFLQSKLTEVGLNNKEKNDFISYWLPEMVAKDAPYYRIGFLQTNELNSLFPMAVSPAPDTIFRIFMDYSPLSDKPRNLPQPQTLEKLTRKGFTLVEWGGLKRQ